MMARGQKKEKKELTPEERLQNVFLPKEEWPYELPEGWKWVRIGDLNQFKSISVNPADDPDKIYELYSVPSWDNNYPEIIKGKDIGSTKQAVKKGDVLLCKINPRINRVWYVSKYTEHELIASSEWIVIRNKGIEPRYLMYCLESQYFRRLMLSNVSGVGGSLMRAKPKYVKNYLVPIAPSEIQKKIADFLDKEFQRLDEAKDQIQSVLDSSEERKQSILHKAFAGELTKQWRKERGISFNWAHTKLIDVLAEKPRNGKSPKPVSYQTKVKSMTLSAVTSGVFLPEYYKFVDIDVEPDSYLWLSKGDILVERSNSLEKVGSSALYTGQEHEFIYPDLMMKLRVNKKVVPEFLAYQLKIDKIMNYFRDNATGTAGNMPKINQKTVSLTPILLPTIEEQKAIVQIIDRNMKAEEAIYNSVDQARDQIDELRKSLLSKALRGELKI